MEVPLGTTGTANAAVESWNVDSAAATVVVVVATEDGCDSICCGLTGIGTVSKRP